MHPPASQIDLLPIKPNMTTIPADSQPVARLKALARTASLAVILVGGLVLFGWAFNIPALKSLWPGLATMKPNTALAFIGVGVSLWLLGGKPTPARRRLAQAGAAFVAVLALLTLSQDLFGWNLGLDQLLFRDTPAAGSTTPPGRMSEVTAFNFILTGGALLLLDVKRRWGRRAAQGLVLAVGMMALLALVGYAYDVQSLYHIAPFSSVALHTAFTFFVLALAILCARPNRGIMALITQETMSGSMVRRLLPAAIVLPIVVGWLRLLGQRLGLYGTEMGLALFALANVVIFTGLILWSARLLQRTDAERKRAEEQLHYQADLIENVSDAIIATDLNFNITAWNKAAETIYGWPAEEVLGQPTTAVLQTEYPEQREITLKELLEAGKWTGEIVHRRKDGAAMYIFASTALLKNSVGQPVGSVSVNRDITERKRVEEQFRLVVEASPNAILLVDSAGQINLMNAQAEKLFGYTRQELLGQPVERLVPAQFHAVHQGYRNVFLKTPTTRAMGAGRDLFGVRKDGSQVPIEIGLNPITTSEGNFVLASIIDITERKRAEERFRSVVEASPQAIILVSTTGQINLVNTRAEALFGYTRAELLGQPIEMLVPPQFRPQHNHHRDTFFAAPSTRAMGAGRDLFGLRKDGSQIPIEIGLNPITTNEGNFVLASVIDITMRQWMEEALRESEARYRRTLDNMLGSCQIIDFDWRYVYLNDAAARQGKRKRTELLGHTMMEIYPGIENTELFTVLQRCMTERSLEHMENKFIYPDGMVNWFELSIQPVPEGIFILSLDISERKQAEEHLRLVVEASPNAIILASMEGQINLVNAQAEVLFGYTREELIGQPVEMLIPPEVRAEHRGYRDAFRKLPMARPMGAGRDLFGLRKDGRQVPIEVGLNPIATSQGTLILASVIDITERKRAEEALLESEERTRLIVENALDGAITINTASTLTGWNAQAEAIFGWSRQEVLGQSLDIILPPQYREAHHRGLKHFLATGEGPVLNQRIEISAQHRDGYEFPVELAISAVRSGNGFIFSAFIRDIAKRKQAEAAVRQSEERFAKAFRASPAALSITRLADGYFVDVNESFLHIFEYSREELIGHRSTELNMFPNPDERAESVRLLREQGSVRNYEMTMRAKSGELLSVLFSTEMIELEGETHALAILFDITKRKRAEEELKQTAAELARSNTELEQFAYIASHDLQEPLRAMASMLQLLQRRYGGQLDDRADEFIRHAVEGASRMQTLIADLLNFSRVGTRGQPLQLTDCAEVLTAVLANLAVAIRESQASITHDPLPTVMADRTQLIQLFQNLLANAIKFCGDEAPVIHIGVEQKDGEYLFAVRDNGIGLEVEYFERVFGIFQRLHTRREYPGTGIGLAVCKKIVERHKGRIWVESEPGQGSVFYFTLPDRR